MEKILILDLQLSKLSSTSSTSSSSSSSTTSTSNDIFDDHPSIILTGLLDVVQRSTIELKSFIDNENDRLVLNEILRKSLLIIEILVKEKKNRQKITDAPDIIWYKFFFL